MDIIVGPLELKAKKLIGYDTPCETPGEFTDFSNVCPTPLQA